MLILYFKRVWVTGDTHGDFDWLADWCHENETTRETDLLIICGDAGIMYFGQNTPRETEIKCKICRCPVTLLCVRGNHESRPAHYDNICFKLIEDDPIVPSGYYYEPEWPYIRYVADGSTFNINDKRCLFIGGAYSIDKEYRQLMRWRWFEDEELALVEQHNILDKIDHHSFDFVFTHTCPEDWQPYDLFMSGVDQSKVSKSMEYFLETVSEIISFKNWYFGHFHDTRFNMSVERTHDGQGDVHMIFDQVKRIM